MQFLKNCSFYLGSTFSRLFSLKEEKPLSSWFFISINNFNKHRINFIFITGFQKVVFTPYSIALLVKSNCHSPINHKIVFGNLLINLFYQIQSAHTRHYFISVITIWGWCGFDQIICFQTIFCACLGKFKVTYFPKSINCDILSIIIFRHQPVRLYTIDSPLVLTVLYLYYIKYIYLYTF